MPGCWSPRPPPTPSDTPAPASRAGHSFCSAPAGSSSPSSTRRPAHRPRPARRLSASRTAGTCASSPSSPTAGHSTATTPAAAPGSNSSGTRPNATRCRIRSYWIQGGALPRAVAARPGQTLSVRRRPGEPGGSPDPSQPRGALTAEACPYSAPARTAARTPQPELLALFPPLTAEHDEILRAAWSSALSLVAPSV